MKIANTALNISEPLPSKQGLKLPAYTCNNTFVTISEPLPSKQGLKREDTYTDDVKKMIFQNHFHQNKD